MLKGQNESKEEKKLISFRKFSDLSSKKNTEEEVEEEPSAMPFSDEDMPQGPNSRTKKEKREQFMDTSHLKTPKSEESNEQVQFIGKIAKLPKGVKASKGYNFLENLKVSKSSVWYLMIEKQNNELQMVKYNHKKGVDLSKFVNELKDYYTKKTSNNPKVCKLIESIEVDGNDKYSWIKNIPHLEIEGKKMISRITEDLIKLLSK